MHRKSFAGNLVPIDLEIEATCRRNEAERHRNFLQDIEATTILEEPQSSESSSSFPETRESDTALLEANTIADEQPRRVSLEDYLSTSVPQFFTSIVRPEVQAQNITYPYSLIQLIQGNQFHCLPNEDPYAHLATKNKQPLTNFEEK